MRLLPSPAALRRAAGRRVTILARTLLRVAPEPIGDLNKVPDDLPRDTLFRQPLIAMASVVGTPERLEDSQATVTFRVVVKDADGKRCPDIHVEARVRGPEREAIGELTTDMLGGCKLKMTGPVGSYDIEVLDVAALALTWDAEASTTTAHVNVA
ncbi:MAG: hypothetical protein ACJA2H_000007 [Nitriliruptoraceae bacterium]